MMPDEYSTLIALLMKRYGFDDGPLSAKTAENLLEFIDNRVESLGWYINDTA